MTFVYGGGPGTVFTMVEAMQSGNPIIVVKNSGRAADCVIDWKEHVRHFAAPRRHSAVKSL